MYKTRKLHLRSCCFDHKTFCFFAAVVDVAVVVLKLPILVQSNETMAMFVPEEIVWGLKPHELMLKPFFVPRNLQSC